MKNPLLVSVCGVEGMGVGAACERVAVTLNKFGINTVVVNLVTPKRTREFEDNWVLGQYHHVDVVIVKRHGYTHSAVKMRLNAEHTRWMPDSVRPDFACLLTCAEDVYAQRNNIHQTHINADNKLLSRRADYERIKAHWGTTTVHKIDVRGKHGRLFAAGQIMQLIRQELGYATDPIS